jgi:hypothetical protein
MRSPARRKQLRRPVTITRQPLQRTAGRRVARPFTLPSPVGGLNARDGLAAMRSNDAVILDNWFPQQRSVISRPGYSQHCDTGESGTVKTLVQYEAGIVQHLLAAVSGKIYNVTTGTPSSLATGLGSDNWVTSELGNLLFLVNGVDVVKSYNGSTIANPAFTGVTLSNLNFITTYKKRLFFVEKNSKSMWYGGIGSVAGALTQFNFSTAVQTSGNLMLLGAIHGDGGDGGSDDIFVAVFEGGTVVAYTGSDPGDANSWALLGVFHIGRPLSRFGILNAGDDLYILTSRGYEPIARMVRSGLVAEQSRLLSDRIQLAVSEEIQSVGNNDDWKFHLYAPGQMFIVTIPRVGTARRHHVRNINTGRWCRFTELPAFSWSMLGNSCFFGSNDGVVYAFDDGSLNDNGATIRCDGQIAWSFLGHPGYEKQMGLIKTLFTSDGQPSTSINVGVDFQDIPIGSFSTAIDPGEFAIWDEAEWDAAFWSGAARNFSPWVKRNAKGDAIGLRIVADASESRIEWHLTKGFYSLGGLL